MSIATSPGPDAVRAGGLAMLIALTLVACDGSGDDGGSRERARSGLATTPLRPDEAPDGLALDEEAGGPLISFRDVLPPRRSAPHLPSVPGSVRDSFEAGYRTVYRRDGEGDGISTATSSAVRFTETIAAGDYLSYLETVRTGVVDPEGSAAVVQVSLGDEAFAWEHVVPGGATSEVVWRREGLVVIVALAGSIGSSGIEQALELARRIDARLR